MMFLHRATTSMVCAALAVTLAFFSNEISIATAMEFGDDDVVFVLPRQGTSLQEDILVAETPAQNQDLDKDPPALEQEMDDEPAESEVVVEECPPNSSGIRVRHEWKGETTKIRVGVNAIRGFEAAQEEYSIVYGDYLTKTAGRRFNPPLEFEMIPMTAEDLFNAAEHEKMDFFFANPGIFSCLGVEFDATALATVIAKLNVRGRTFDLDVFAGVMIARADRDDIQTVHDFKDKVIGAGALSMILAGQVQFYEMEKAGLSYVMDPKQVVFTYNQFDVVNGVLDGTYDVGFVRTDQIERGTDKDGKPLDTSLFNVIQPKIYVTDDGDIFPFLHSTDIFPEFAFGAMPHTDKNLVEEVQRNLFNLGDYAAVGEALETCYNTISREHCDSLPFPRAFLAYASCKTTKDIAWTALNATRAGSIAGFRPARSYFNVRTMHEAGGFMLQDKHGNWKCTRATNLYEGINCPSGFIKVDEDAFGNNCEKDGLPCEESYDCFCKPCLQEISVFPVFDHDEEDFMSHRNLCSAGELCATVQQAKHLTFRAVDNSGRDKIDLRAVMTIHGASTELHVKQVNGTSDYEFVVRNPTTGIASIHVLVNDVPIPSSPFQVTVTQRNCDGEYKGQRRQPTEDGECICDTADLEAFGTCLQSHIIFSLIAAFLTSIALFGAYFYIRHKRNLSDQVWLVNAEELHFNDPLDIIGQGSFGQVILAEYRGTKVAIKRVLRKENKKKGGSNILKTGGSFGGTRSFDRHDPPSTDDAGFMGETVATRSNDSNSGSLDGDIETGEKVEPGKGKGATYGTDTVDLELLGKLSLGGRDTKWTQLCPGGIKDDERYRMKSNILGSSTGGSRSKSSIAHIFSCFDKQHQRQQEFIMEMRLLSRLRHPCITTVMGAVLSSFHDPMLVMEYMEYGSLRDLLQNETMYTGGDVILQIMRDIAQGLRYLHSSKPPICHGDLKARNILIDSRFRAKVADFGLSEKKKNGLTGTPYFMAPEYLRGRTYNTACDIYSVGIIMYEIYARKDPYEGEPLMKVLREVCDPSVNRRPRVPEVMPQKMVDTMKKCWSPDPFYRPQAKDLDMILMDMNIQEAEPVSREQKLAKKNENKPHQDVLYDVFPRHIADALKAGRKVEAETHDLVTIFFSDIVGFTDISQALPPMKVSLMLERLYTCFDKLARAHKVFKVETIGDAYMGVTNLDETQENEHAKNIAEFALDAIEGASKILIDEDHPEKGCIKIRVGFHSGPVVANVIGSMNPRYGLFGDAVNTASRMESNSKALRILCSEASAELLQEQAPHLVVRKRGKVEIKGKGQMMTYWVEPPKQKDTTSFSSPDQSHPTEEETTETSLHVDFVDGH